MDGGGVTSDNVGLGRLCSLPPSLAKTSGTAAAGDTFVQGVVFVSPRAKALAAWFAGTEVVGVSCDLRKRIMVLETDIDSEFLVAKLNDEQRMEANVFEEGKAALEGLHFVSIQVDENEDPEGFWLLRELPTGI